MNRFEAQEEWGKVKQTYEELGVVLPGVTMFVPDEWRSQNLALDQFAMDEAGTLSTSQNSALPALLTTAVLNTSRGCTRSVSMVPIVTS